MIVMEYLKSNVANFNSNLPIELKDIIDGRGIYCNGYYNALIQELSKDGLEHVRNARFIDVQMKDDCYKIFYMKDIKDYDDFDLEQLLEKLHGN